MNAVTQTAAAEPVSGIEMFVPLNKLKKSPSNARKVPHSEATIEALAGSIQHKGMIQNLVIEPEVRENGTPTGCYLVTAGEGRRQAQLLRAKRKQIRKTQPIRCYLDTKNDPAEISLDENVTVNALRLPWDRKPRSLRTADRLAGALALDVAKDWTPTVDSYLGHVYHVRDQVDLRPSTDKKRETTATATRKLYIRFLFYRNFVVAPKPLIIPEGRTDPIYLRAAIEKLAAYHPRLGAMDKGKFKPTLKFMNFSSTVHDVLQVGNGTGDLLHFIRKYADALKHYRHRPLPNPVIVLIDNDDGAKDIFAIAKNLNPAPISWTSTDPFYRLGPNLYLIKTPEIGPKGTSCIEDLFNPALLKTVLGGNVFDPNKKHGEAGKYGKTRFAEKVVQPQKDTIDFAKFAGLLDRIVAALDDYSANPPPP